MCILDVLLSFCLIRSSVTLHVCVVVLFFFLMIRRPPRSTLDRSSAASDVYKRQGQCSRDRPVGSWCYWLARRSAWRDGKRESPRCDAVSYTHLRAHETVLDLVCRLLLEKKKTPCITTSIHVHHNIRQNTDKILVRE